MDSLDIDSQEYFKFTIVRNPYSWILSILGNRYQSPMNVRNTLINRIKFQIAEYTGIRKFPSQHFYQMYPDGSFKSFILFIDYLASSDAPSFAQEYLGATDQYSYIENARNIEFDFVGKLKNMNQDLEKINQILKLDNNLEVPYINQKSKITNRQKYLDYYDEESIQIVNRIFVRDFETFGYQLISNLAKHQSTA